MKTSLGLRRKISLVAISAGISVAASLLLTSGRESPLSEVPRYGHPRLLSVQPLPVLNGPMCEWVPASAGLSLAAALQQEQLSAAAEAAPDDARRRAASQRRPERIIRDPYMAYSSVAVDAVHDEVIMTDENLFNIVVYDRKANTPPSASMTEAKADDWRGEHQDRVPVRPLY